MLLPVLVVVALVVLGGVSQLAVAVTHVDSSSSSPGRWLRVLLFVPVAQFFVGAIGVGVMTSSDPVVLVLGAFLLVAGGWLAFDPSTGDDNPRRFRLLTSTGRARLDRVSGGQAVVVVLVAALLRVGVLG